MVVLRNLLYTNRVKDQVDVEQEPKTKMKTKMKSKSKSKSKSILLVDDEQIVLDGLRRMIRSQRNLWTVTVTTDGREVQDILSTQRIDTIVSDMSMPVVHGLEVLRGVKEHHPHILRIALTGFVDEQWKVKHNQNVAQVVLLKPCSAGDLISAIESPEKFAWLVTSNVAGMARTQLPPPDTEPIWRSPWSDNDEVTFS